MFGLSVFVGCAVGYGAAFAYLPRFYRLQNAEGYSWRECRRAVLDGCRPVSYVGFAVGTLYQYLLLKLMVTIVFAEVDAVPNYSFDFTAFVISLAAFLVSYEVLLFCYGERIQKTPLKSVMQEN